jgi:plastocyanin
MKKRLLKSFLGLSILLMTFQLFITVVYAGEVGVHVKVNEETGKIESIDPETQTVGNGDTVKWSSEGSPYHTIKIIVPDAGKGPFPPSDYFPGGGFEYETFINRDIWSPPVSWPPNVDMVKYTIEIRDNLGILTDSRDPYLRRPGVGGIVVPVDKFGLLAPWIAIASIIIVATATYFRHVKHRKEVQ